jgi:hypothetical protein
MKTEQIVQQLQLTLPLFSDLFGDFVTPTSITVVSNVATIVSSAHGLVTGQKVAVKNGVVPNALTSITAAGKVATAVTANAHDLTDGFTQLVTITGATEVDYNGTFGFISVVDANTFKYQLTDVPTASPATGSPILTEPRLTEGVNGLKTITVVDDDTFTYTAEETPDVTLVAGTYSAVTNPQNILIGHRISGAVDVARAMESYTKQDKDKLWLFAIREESTVSRDRNTTSDAVGQFAASDDIRQRVIPGFSVYAVIPTRDSLSGMRERDMMEDVFSSLCRSLVGVEFDSPFTQQTWASVVAVGHGFFDYIGAYYVHRFVFETQYDLTFCDTARANDLTRAFRQAGITVAGSSDENVEKLTVNATIN